MKHRKPPSGDDLGIGLIVIAMAVGLLLTLSAEMTALVTFHRWMSMPDGAMAAVPVLLFHLNDPGRVLGSGIRLSAPLFWVVTIVEVGLLLGIGAVNRKLLSSLKSPPALARTRPGLSSRDATRSHLGERAARRRGQMLRPSVDVNAPLREFAVRLGRDLWGTVIYGTLEDVYLIVGTPRSGKGSALYIPIILDWVGPALITSTRSDLLDATTSTRLAAGPVYLFDPMGLVDDAQGAMRVGMPLERGCEDPSTARRRAQTLVGASNVGKGVTDGSHWRSSAEEVLALQLHAAALGGYTMRDVRLWSTRPDHPDPLRVLQNSPQAAPTWPEMYRAFTLLDDKERSGVWSSLRRALAPLADPKILQWCVAGGSQPAFDVDRFFDEKNATLHVVGPRSDHDSLAPILSCLIDTVVLTAQYRSHRTPGRRLDPPLGVFLDECAHIARLPQLPQLTGDSSGSGIVLFMGFHSASQLRAIWGDAGMRTIRNNSTAMIVFGGGKDHDDTEELARLCGEREETVRSITIDGDGHKSETEVTRRVPVLSASDIRELPQWQALVLYRGLKPMITQLTPWFEDKALIEVVGRTVHPVRHDR